MNLTGVLITDPPVPGSSEWLGHMSASKVASAIGMVGAFDSPMGLWSKMTARTPSGDIDPDRVTYGRYLEDALLAWVADTHEGEVTPGESYHHPEHREYTAAPDGHLWHPDGTVSLIECKTAMDAYQWGAEHTAEIPPKYLVQCAWQMYVTGARHVLVPADVGMTFRLYEVHWDDVAEDMPGVLAAVEQFMAHVKNNTPPAWDGSDQTYQAVRYWHPEIEDTEVEVSTDTAQALAAALVARKNAEATERELKARLLAEMGTARKAVTPGGMTVATRQSRNGGTPALITARGLPHAAPQPTAHAA